MAKEASEKSKGLCPKEGFKENNDIFCDHKVVLVTGKEKEEACMCMLGGQKYIEGKWCWPQKLGESRYIQDVGRQQQNYPVFQNGPGVPGGPYRYETRKNREVFVGLVMWSFGMY